MEATSRLTAVLRRPRLLGVLLAALAFIQSTTPSLMTRSWYFQGAVSGVSTALGYALGALLTWLVVLGLTAMGRRPEPLDEARDVRLRSALLVVLVLVLVWASRRSVRMHRWTWERLDHDPNRAWLVYGGTLLVTALVLVALFALAGAYAWLRNRTARLGARWLPRWAALTVATVLATWLVVTALNDWVYQRTLDGFNEAFTISDLEIEGNTTAPTSRLRSAGPASQVDWDEVGDEGRRFLTRGPSVEQLGEWTDDEPLEPVRVFVGRATSDDPQVRTTLAMAELERFGAFEREVVLVVVPTGTGWVNEQIVQPVEYLHGGDVATVSMQYSHLPSPLAFLTEASAAQDSANALIDAVHARLAGIEASRRPQLLVAGESLGSFGGSAAYASLEELTQRTDASLWVGPPPTMHLRREAERRRVGGSLQIKPELGGDSEILFANRASDIVGQPRAVFLQQADDAIVWWDWSTALVEPDWLKEPLDPAVNPEMRWYPISTFLNLAVDMVVSTAFEEDQGHRYGTQATLAWAAMLAPDGWDAARVADLRVHLAEDAS